MIKNSKKEALKPGTVLEGHNFRYKIADVLGLGSFGITYLADIVNKEGVKTNMRVALKELFIAECNERKGNEVTIFKDAKSFNEYKGKFTREADNLHEIDHSNIINVFEWFEANGTAYYSMTYIDGDSLQKVIEKKGKLRESDALEVSERIAGALDTLHSFGLLHLDVKPANIMMSGGKVPVLIDFGLAKHFNDEGEPDTSLGINEGSPGFAPMEQSTYKPGKGMPTTIDVYALGGTLFNMITGQEPPVASDIYNYGFPKDELEKAGASEQTISLIDKAMSPLWKDRYPTARQMEKSVRALIDGETEQEASDTAGDNSAERASEEPQKIAPMPAAEHEPEGAAADSSAGEALADESTQVNMGELSQSDERTQVSGIDNERTLVATAGGWTPDEGTQVDVSVPGQYPGQIPPSYPGEMLPPPMPEKKNRLPLYAFIGAAVIAIAVVVATNISTGWLTDLCHVPVETVVLDED